MKTCRSNVRYCAKIGSWVVAIAVAILVLCWMSAAAVAIDKPVVTTDGDFTPMGTITVNETDDGQGMVGGFTSSVGEPPSLAAAAAANGDDHFNWFHWVIKDNMPPNDAAGNPLVEPYYGPPLGGYSNRWADNDEWYWDEGADPSPTDPGYEHWVDGYNLDDNTSDANEDGVDELLEFRNFPEGPEGTFRKFVTWLVGLDADGRFHSLLGFFEWEWGWPPGGDPFLNIPIQGDPPKPPGTKFCDEGDLDGDRDVDEDDLAIMAEFWQMKTGATCEMGDLNNDTMVNDIDATILAANWTGPLGAASVPEPSTFVGLLGLCLAGLLASARRKR